MFPVIGLRYILIRGLIEKSLEFEI